MLSPAPAPADRRSHGKECPAVPTARLAPARPPSRQRTVGSLPPRRGRSPPSRPLPPATARQTAIPRPAIAPPAPATRRAATAALLPVPRRLLSAAGGQGPALSPPWAPPSH